MDKNMIFIYLGSGVVGEPDGGEVAPPELALGDVSAAAELIADPDGVVSAFTIVVESFVFFA